jgi:hypothetical protein
MADVNVLLIVLNVGFLVLSLGVHEAAHAWVAWLCGDPTAKEEGRLTLNPLAHLDPFLSVIPLLYVFPGFIFGGARPVPMAGNRMPDARPMLSALAGTTNFVRAILFLLLWKILVFAGDRRQHGRGASKCCVTGLVLAAFNGSRAAARRLPKSCVFPAGGSVRVHGPGPLRVIIVFGLLT